MPLTTYSTGTVSIDADGAVTVAGGIWSATNVTSGDMISVDGAAALLLNDVSDATHGQLVGWTGGAVSDKAYVVYQCSSLRFEDVQIAQNLDKQVAALNTEGFYVFVRSAATGPDPSLGDDGQYAFQAASGKLWIKEGGVWVFVGINKAFGIPAPWDSEKAYVAFDVATLDGTSYVATAPNTNQQPPDADYWQVLAAKGDVGAAGDAATVEVGTVTTLPYGSPATVTNVGDDHAATLNFGIPAGQDGTGTGDVEGPASATDASVVGFSGTDGKHVRELTPAEVRAAVEASTVGAAVLTADDEGAARAAIYAAPIDALSFSGMQINGAMEVSQANTGGAATLTATSTLGGQATHDGFTTNYRGSFVASVQQVDAPAGMPAVKALKISVTTAQASLGSSDELSIIAQIEGYRFNRLLFGTTLASPVSIGFWFQAHRVGTYSGSIRNAAKDRSYPFSFNVLNADTPQWISLTGIVGETSGTWGNNSGLGASISICLAAGSGRVSTAGAWANANYSGATGSVNGVGATSDVFYLSNLIVLPGAELPPADRVNLIMRPYDNELEACRRYYWKGLPFPTGNGLNFNAYASGVYMSWYIPHPRVMRDVPVLSNDFTGTSVTGCAVPNIQTPTIYGLKLITNSTAAGGLVYFSFASGNYIAADSRL